MQKAWQCMGFMLIIAHAPMVFVHKMYIKCMLKKWISLNHYIYRYAYIWYTYKYRMIHRMSKLVLTLNNFVNWHKTFTLTFIFYVYCFSQYLWLVMMFIISGKNYILSMYSSRRTLIIFDYILLWDGNDQY